MTAAALRPAIKGMLQDARMWPGRPIMRTVAEVFTLTITQGDNGKVKVELARSNTAPNEAAWVNILEQWPEVVPPGVTPRPHKEGRRYSLVADWARPAEIAQRA